MQAPTQGLLGEEGEVLVEGEREGRVPAGDKYVESDNLCQKWLSSL